MKKELKSFQKLAKGEINKIRELKQREVIDDEQAIERLEDTIIAFSRQADYNEQRYLKIKENYK
jgi:hypothetical protein